MLSLFDGFDGIEHRFETSAKDQYEASQWVRYEFDLFEKDTQNPLAVYQGDDSLCMLPYLLLRQLWWHAG